MATGDTTVGSRPDPSVTGGEVGVYTERRTFRLSLAGLLTTMALASLDQKLSAPHCRASSASSAGSPICRG
jgi:hypothetical protein